MILCCFFGIIQLGNGNNYVVTEPDGLQNLFTESTSDSALEEARANGFAGVTIHGVHCRHLQRPLAEAFKGILQGEDATIKLSGDNGLFNQIANGSIVENISINVNENISKGYNSGNYVWAGAAAGYNEGSITDCDVNLTGKTIISDAAGGIVGHTSEEVNGCYQCNGKITAIAESANNGARAGGLVGYNSGTVNASYSDSSQIEARAKNTNNNYDIATVPEAEGENTDCNPNTDTKGNASAGTKIGDNNSSGPVTHIPTP